MPNSIKPIMRNKHYGPTEAAQAHWVGQIDPVQGSIKPSTQKQRRRDKMKLEDLLSFLNIDPTIFAKRDPSLIAETLTVAETDDFSKVHQWGYTLKGEINDPK